MAEWLFLFQEFSLNRLSAAVCDGAEHPTSTDHRPANSARITMKLGAGWRGESQLSFALLFMSSRAFSEQKNYPNIPNFRCMSGGVTCNTNFRVAPFALVTVLWLSETVLLSATRQEW